MVIIQCLLDAPLIFCSRKCHIIYRYGDQRTGESVHLLEHDKIDLKPEEGDCNVSDFCRVSIFKLASAAEDEFPRNVLETELRRGQPTDTWYCSNCGCLNVSYYERCPVCNIGLLPQNVTWNF